MADENGLNFDFVDMEIDDDLILKLEKLTRLELSAEERQLIREDLSSILSMVDRLGEPDLAEVEPLRHLSDVEHTTREDVVGLHLSTAKALANAPDSDGSHFRVPSVIPTKP